MKGDDIHRAVETRASSVQPDDSTSAERTARPMGVRAEASSGDTSTVFATGLGGRK